MPTSTRWIYTLSLHDALPIYEGIGGVSAGSVEGADESCGPGEQAGDVGVAIRTDDVFWRPGFAVGDFGRNGPTAPERQRDRKSTRLNSSHLGISYAVFCLKKK